MLVNGISRKSPQFGRLNTKIVNSGAAQSATALSSILRK